MVQGIKGKPKKEAQDPMKVMETPGGYELYKEKDCIGRCTLRKIPQGAVLEELTISPEWRRRGYGSYLLKEALRRCGGYEKNRESFFTAPLPADRGELAFWAKFGFSEQGGRLERRRRPDLTAVQLVQDFLAGYLRAPKLCVDATCGNGGDTLFLCNLTGPGGHVLGMDIQPEAIASTRARLEKAGIQPERYTLVCDGHQNLLDYVRPGCADAVLFNFGWLPGADHGVFSTAATTLPALEAALGALRPGGVLTAILYSGKTIGSEEKQAVLEYLRALPLEKYTVLVCEFANWADTAPLPCILIKR